MSDTPFMPLWVSDFLGDTTELNGAEIGAYMLLIMAQWNRSGASLPNDQDKLKRIARIGRNWSKVWAELERYFVQDEDGYYNKRVRYEYELVCTKRAVNKQNGARGGRAKALKNKEVGLANATNSLERNSSIPEPEPEPEPDITSKRGNNIVLLPSKTKPVSEEKNPFDKFWDAYPRKVAKGKARTAFAAALKKGVTADEIMDGLHAFKTYHEAVETETEYICHPATWLRGERWGDEFDLPEESGKSAIEQMKEQFRLEEEAENGKQI